jgi:hypothetical protein
VSGAFVEAFKQLAAMDDHQDKRDRRRLAVLEQQRTRLEADRVGFDLDEDGRTWLPKKCIVCANETRMRCAGCRMAVCHLHATCPNGCDDVEITDACGASGMVPTAQCLQSTLHIGRAESERTERIDGQPTVRSSSAKSA